LNKILSSKTWIGIVLVMLIVGGVLTYQHFVREIEKPTLLEKEVGISEEKDIQDSSIAPTDKVLDNSENLSDNGIKPQDIDGCFFDGCPSGAYCIDNKCQKDSVETIKKDIIGSHIGGMASNNPNDYLGDHVFGLPEVKWRTHQPIVDKVNELTIGISSNSEKAKAIATWVKNSKTIGAYDIYVKNSIIDVFNTRIGACTEAAVLTTAMLRMAGIPARAVSCPTKIHAYTEAYIDKKWVGIDATFASGDAVFYDGTLPVSNSILNVRNWVEFPAEKIIITKELFNERPLRIVATSMSKPTFIKKDILYSERLSQFSLPIGEAKKVKWGKINYIRPYFLHNNIAISGVVAKTEDLECSAYHCIGDSYGEFAVILSDIIRIYGRKYLYNKDGTLYDPEHQLTTDGPFMVAQFFPYRVVSTLPPGEYQLTYRAEIANQAPVDFAYTNTNIASDGEVFIEPNQLIKSPGIKQEDFDAFIQYLKLL